MLKTSAGNDELVYVLTSYFGEIGGGAKAGRLLSDAIVESGRRVKVFATVCQDPKLVEQFREQGVEVVQPFISRGCRWNIPDRALALQLYSHARRDRPTLIHVVSVGGLASHLLRLPPIAPIYLWETTEALPHVKFVDLSISKLLSRAAVILAPSETVARNVRSTYGYRGDIRILPFWVEDPGDDPSSLLSPRSQNLLYVGRLDVDKGFQYLFEALRSARMEYPNLTLTVCGGGDLAGVRRLAGDDPAVEFRGVIDERELEQAFRRCDALVLPSLHEGYPLVLLESWARYRPVIATAVGSVPEICDGRPCAIVVPSADSSALRKAIIALLSEEEDAYRARCLDARAQFESISSPKAVQQHLRDAYAPSLATGAVRLEPSHDTESCVHE